MSSITTLRRLLTNKSATLSTELAIIAPMMLLLALATVDTVNYVLTANKVTRVTAQTADAVARADSIADQDGDDDDGGAATNIGGYFLAANEMGKPLDLEDAGRVIISSVANIDGTGPRIVWQRTGDYGLAVESNIGVEGQLAALPEGMDLARDENAIVTEVFYQFDPLIFSANLLSGNHPETIVLERMNVFRPRLAPITVLQ